MNTLINIVVGFRNRDLIRVRRFFESLTLQSVKNFDLLFIDYGSEPAIAREAAALCSEYAFVRYYYSNSIGLPWNRSLALNCGVKLATAEYVMTTDIDMLFSSNFMEEATNRLSLKNIIYSQCYYLGEEFTDYENIENYKGKYPISSTNNEFGGCQIVHTGTLKGINGFDEYFRIWGLEDKDINQRLVQMGLSVIWLDTSISQLFHQWHPIVSHKNKSITPTGWYETMWSYYQTPKTIIRNDENWGELLNIHQRPALNETIINSAFRFNFIQPLSISYLEFLKAFKELNFGQAMAISFEDKKVNLPTLIKTKLSLPLNFLLKRTGLPHRILLKNAPLQAFDIKDYLFYFTVCFSNEIKDYKLEFTANKIDFVVVKN